MQYILDRRDIIIAVYALNRVNKAVYMLVCSKSNEMYILVCAPPPPPVIE